MDGVCVGDALWGSVWGAVWCSVWGAVWGAVVGAVSVVAVGGGSGGGGGGGGGAGACLDERRKRGRFATQNEEAPIITINVLAEHSYTLTSFIQNNNKS